MTVIPLTTERNAPNITAFNGSLLVLSTGVVFSFGGLAFRLTDDMSAWQYVVFRGVGAIAATLLILSYRYRLRFGPLVSRVEGSHVVAGLLLGAISTIFIVAIEHASVAFVLFLQTLAPLTAAYFSWLLLRERVSAAVGAATAVSIVGVVVMVSGTITDAVEPLGLIAILIPIVFGLYATLIRHTKQIDPQIPVMFAGVTLVAAGLVGSGVTDGLGVSLHDALIGLGAGSALLAIPVAVFNLAQRVVPAPETSLLLMSEVVLAPVWVWLFVDEEPEVTTLIGGAIILTAVMGLLVWRRRTARRQAALYRGYQEAEARFDVAR